MISKDDMAKRLACVAWGREVFVWYPALLRIADEVIRQMRWSRHEYRWASPETTEWDDGMDPTEEPSMAPVGWNPDSQPAAGIGEEWR